MDKYNKVNNWHRDNDYLFDKLDHEFGANFGSKKQQILDYYKKTREYIVSKKNSHEKTEDVLKMLKDIELDHEFGVDFDDECQQILDNFKLSQSGKFISPGLENSQQGSENEDHKKILAPIVGSLLLIAIGTLGLVHEYQDSDPTPTTISYDW